MKLRTLKDHQHSSKKDCPICNPSLPQSHFESKPIRYHTTKAMAKFYELALGAKWPESVPRVGSDGRLYACWILGNDFRNKTPYYGAFPPNLLTRIYAMFPDATKETTLHLFSGSLPKGTIGQRVDINPKTKPDIVADAHHLSEVDFKETPHLIIADPPYSVEDALHYGTSMIKRNIVVQECYKTLAPGGWLVWFDQVLPQFRKREFEWLGWIAVSRSTNHRFRCITMFRKRQLVLKVRKK